MSVVLIAAISFGRNASKHPCPLRETMKPLFWSKTRRKLTKRNMNAKTLVSREYAYSL